MNGTNKYSQLLFFAVIAIIVSLYACPIGIGQQQKKRETPTESTFEFYSKLPTDFKEKFTSDWNVEFEALLKSRQEDEARYAKVKSNKEKADIKKHLDNFKTRVNNHIKNNTPYYSHETMLHLITHLKLESTLSPEQKDILQYVIKERRYPRVTISNDSPLSNIKTGKVGYFDFPNKGVIVQQVISKNELILTTQAKSSERFWLEGINTKDVVDKAAISLDKNMLICDGTTSYTSLLGAKNNDKETKNSANV